MVLLSYFFLQTIVCLQWYSTADCNRADCNRVGSLVLLLKGNETTS